MFESSDVGLRGSTSTGLFNGRKYFLMLGTGGD